MKKDEDKANVDSRSVAAGGRHAVLAPNQGASGLADPAAALTVSSTGRLCLFGEHSDWAADYGKHRGCCLVVGTDQSIKALVRRSDRFIVESPIPDEFGRYSGRSRQMSCDWLAKTLREAAQDDSEFFRYCAGVAHEMFEQFELPHGLDIRITDMDLPLRKGVSSSAAVCILVAHAFNRFFDLKMFPHEIMEVAYQGERLTGSQCGRMDQACIYGKTPVLLIFEKSKEVKIEPIFPSNDLFLFFVDLGGRKDTVAILNGLQGGYPDDVGIQEALGASNERTVRSACTLIQEGDGVRLGRLMVDAQREFDRKVAPHSSTQLTSPLLHELLESDAIAQHVHGGKGVGSQGDGTAQFVAKSKQDRDAAMGIINEAFPQMRSFPLTITGTRL